MEERSEPLIAPLRCCANDALEPEAPHPLHYPPPPPLQAALQLAVSERQLVSLTQQAAAVAGGGGPEGRRRADLRQLQQQGAKLLNSCKQLVKTMATPPSIKAYDAARCACHFPI